MHWTKWPYWSRSLVTYVISIFPFIGFGVLWSDWTFNSIKLWSIQVSLIYSFLPLAFLIATLGIYYSIRGVRIKQGRFIAIAMILIGLVLALSYAGFSYWYFGVINPFLINSVRI